MKKHIIIAPTQRIAAGYADEQGWSRGEWERIATEASANGRIFPADACDITVVSSRAWMYGVFDTRAVRQFVRTLQAVNIGVRFTRPPAADIHEVQR